MLLLILYVHLAISGRILAVVVVVVQLLSRVQLMNCSTPGFPSLHYLPEFAQTHVMNCSTPGFPALHYLPEFAQTHVTESVMPSNRLILCHPLLLLPSVFPNIRVFSNESTLCIMWPKYWSFSLSISPSNEYLWMISFRIDWFDLLAVQGTLKNLLQHHNLKAWILQCSALFMAQHSHPYMTTGKTIALTRQTCWQSDVSAF